MEDFSRLMAGLPPEQQAMRDKCFYPRGTFVEFKAEGVGQSIPERFEEQVRNYPGRIAVNDGSQQLTYDALNNVANRISRAILAYRGESQEVICPLFEPGAMGIAAFLGVLKANKICVPLDPSLASARTSYILEDSQAAALLTNSRNLPLARALAPDGCRLINLDEVDSDRPTDDPGLDISPDSIAWIIYTSGSTGQPKGAVHSHRNALHMIRDYTNNFHICPEDRMSLLFSFSVHAGVFGTLMPLLNGAGLYSLDISESGVAQIGKWLAEADISIYCSVPTVFRHFASTLSGQERFPSVRLVMLVGEPCYRADVEIYHKVFPADCIFVNRYGCTEADIVSWYFMDQSSKFIGSSVPSGYPPQDKQVLLLDEQRKEIGVDGIGEIAIKSRYLALGYWRKPEVTDEVFLADAEDGEERVYLTGDLGRKDSEGCLVNLGRKDFQVKVRGYRIEVSEIELALTTLESVEEAVVMGQLNPYGDQRLVAYIVPCGQAAPTTSELRKHLSQRLPSYMIPAVFLRLDKFPQAPNGKINRKELPLPGANRPDLENPLVMPRTPIEGALSAIWSELLGLDQVGIHDNFLELGGDSLLAGQVISRVMRHFSVAIPLKAMFDSFTVSDMAMAIVQHQASGVDEENLDRLLAELEAVSNEQAARLLADGDSSR